jgi:hypothetical protein
VRQALPAVELATWLLRFPPAASAAERSLKQGRSRRLSSVRKRCSGAPSVEAAGRGLPEPPPGRVGWADHAPHCGVIA